MSDSSIFWTPGTSLVAQRTDAIEEWHSWAWATRVRQPAGTHNWFHLPLTAASMLGGCRTEIEYGWLRVHPRDRVWIEYVRFHQTSRDFETNGGQIHEESWTESRRIRGKTQVEFDIDRRECVGPVVVSVCAHFMDDGSDADRYLDVFGGALQLEEK